MERFELWQGANYLGCGDNVLFFGLMNRQPLLSQREGEYATREDKNQERRKAGERGRAWREPLCSCSHSYFDC